MTFEDILYWVLGSGLSLIVLAVLFVPMERVFPAKKNQAFFREHWSLDLTFFMGQYFIWGALVLLAMFNVSEWMNSIVPDTIRELIHQQPMWLQALEVLIISDFLIYWGHRLQHRVDFLWRFHKVHHSAEKLDWLAAFREHPLDSIYTIGLINLPAFLFGFDLNAIAIIIAFRGVWAVYIHSNVRLNIGPLKMLIGSPDLHHWHHDLERDRGNYANLSPLMDIIFGTYTCPDNEPEAVGIKDKLPQSYWSQMTRPLIFWKKLNQ